MGISTESWRARIGLFNSVSKGNHQNRLQSFGCLCDASSVFLLLAIICVLLQIGNVELNPGPDTLEYYSCDMCPFKSQTPEQHIQHQELHSGTFNFQYVCPFPSCYHTYTNSRSLSAHLSKHSVSRSALGGEHQPFSCEYCDTAVKTNKEYCLHIKFHLKNNETVVCPLSGDCNKSTPFTTANAFSVHLSLYHPGWVQDYSNTALLAQPQRAVTESRNAETDAEGYAESCAGGIEGGDDRGDDSSEDDSDFGTGQIEHDQIVACIANFYAMLEGKLLVTSSTVDAIAKKLAFLSEILQKKLKNELSEVLVSAGVSTSLASKIIQSLTTSDPLYNAHHKYAPGACLLTSHLREVFYRKHFKHQDSTPINTSKDPHDTENVIQYVNVRETLEVMLEDPTVQREVSESFERSPSDSIIKDYTDGSVYCNSDPPRKCIDLLLFMDAFNCANCLGSAKLKHKVNGLYMTLGNFKPHLRSFLKSIRLVALINEKILKLSARHYKKCFSRIVRDLKNLVEKGIMLFGEPCAVRLQFIQGDNLGQHTIGGFVESFSGSYFCRFCDLSREMFKEDIQKDKPIFSSGEWRTPASYYEDLRAVGEDVHHRGIKRDSPFHKLNHFNVCLRLPPCIAHDLFINGVCDHDMASMINYFIEQGWFTLDELKMRIRRFKYDRLDGRNKPCEDIKAKKLGGHAIQNWTFLRLLPILIGDKVNTTDKVWKLYLLLKSIIELVCAPALSKDQIEIMRSKIMKYLMRRKRLPNPYQPKHHFFSHYPDLFLMFGPLVHLWTMAFEHRHQYFKRVAQICRNFINLPSTLASKYLMLQAYQNMGPLFPSGPVLLNSHPFNLECQDDDFKNTLIQCDLSNDAVEVIEMVLDDTKYKKGEWLIFSGSPSTVIHVGQLDVMLFDVDKCLAIVRIYEAYPWEEYGLHYINFNCIEIRKVELKSNSEGPRPHSVYKFANKLCLSLKHAPLSLCILEKVL